MEGMKKDWKGVVHRVQFTLIDIFAPHLSFNKLQTNDLRILNDLKCPIAPIKTRNLQLVSWSKPSKGYYKLNVDWSSLGNPVIAVVGGVIRDFQGQVIAGFFAHYELVSNIVAEGRALLDGLKLAYNLGIHNIIVESDSAILVQWIKDGKCSLWYLWDYWDDVRRLFVGMNCTIRHVFWEANMVVDYLDEEGALNHCKYFKHCELGRGLIRGLLLTDLWGLPYLRL